jgi:hypothetical protein
MAMPPDLLTASAHRSYPRLVTFPPVARSPEELRDDADLEEVRFSSARNGDANTTAAMRASHTARFIICLLRILEVG